MASWLARATGTLSRDSEDVPQEFLVSCECGQVHRGHRKSKPQRIICQTCGTALFILPRNVYPVLKPQLRKRRRRGSSAARREFPSLGRLTRGVGRGTTAVAGSVGRSVHSVGRSIEQWLAAQAATQFRVIRSQLTPFRLVLVGIIAVLVGTATWTVHTHRLEHARNTLREEFAAADAALDGNDPVVAHEHFQKAAAAADRLQGTDVRSRQARQMLHETTAMTQLAPVSLLDVLDEAERTISGQHPEIWEDRFRATYAGTWFLLDAPIHLADDSREASSVVLDLPLVLGNIQRTVHATVAVAEVAALRLSREPRQAIVAAELTGCELDSAGDRWLVTFRSQSGFLWSDLENLRRLGYFESDWVSEEETRTLLDAQSQILGLQ